jgi:hypothetical protein
MMAIYLKDPEAVLDYGIDWEDWLGTNETITASTWEVQAGIDKDSDSFDNTATVIWLKNGTVGEDYVVTNHITTSANREDDRSMIIKVRAR